MQRFASVRRRPAIRLIPRLKISDRYSFSERFLVVCGVLFVIGWGIFNMLEGLARHDLRHEWLVFATGMGFALLGALLIWARVEPIIERRSGYDRRSGSPVR